MGRFKRYKISVGVSYPIHAIMGRIGNLFFEDLLKMRVEL